MGWRGGREFEANFENILKVLLAKLADPRMRAACRPVAWVEQKAAAGRWAASAFR